MSSPSHGRQEIASRRVLLLDFFRGLALLIIFVNHMPSNELANFTPSRFGFSDSAEIFVFLSGYVASLVYGRYFRQVGLGLGTTAIVYRCFQLYAAHLWLFLAVAGISIVAKNAGVVDYVEFLNLSYFLDDTQEALLGLLKLNYVPNYFDILPLYIILLLWVPVLWWLGEVDRRLALLFPCILYAAMWAFGLELPAHPRGNVSWFFNPFGWQLVFFTGFFLGEGWLRVPRQSRTLFAASLGLVLLAIPFSHEPSFRNHAWLLNWREIYAPLHEKTHLGILRWLHFLALAYLVDYLLAGRESWLRRTWAGVLVQLGQQSLPVFWMGMVLSHAGGMILLAYGKGWPLILWVNVTGIVILITVAYGCSWLDGKPWKRREPSPPRISRFAFPGRILQTGACVALVAVPLVLALQRPTVPDLVATTSTDEWKTPPLGLDWTLGDDDGGLTGQEFLESLEWL